LALSNQPVIQGERHARRSRAYGRPLPNPVWLGKLTEE
jgi:hypothetical protein